MPEFQQGGGLGVCRKMFETKLDKKPLARQATRAEVKHFGSVFQGDDGLIEEIISEIENPNLKRGPVALSLHITDIKCVAVEEPGTNETTNGLEAHPPRAQFLAEISFAEALSTAVDFAMDELVVSANPHIRTSSGLNTAIKTINELLGKYGASMVGTISGASLQGDMLIEIDGEIPILLAQLTKSGGSLTLNLVNTPTEAHGIAICEKTYETNKPALVRDLQEVPEMNHKKKKPLFKKQKIYKSKAI